MSMTDDEWYVSGNNSNVFSLGIECRGKHWQFNHANFSINGEAPDAMSVRRCVLLAVQNWAFQQAMFLNGEPLLWAEAENDLIFYNGLGWKMRIDRVTKQWTLMTQNGWTTPVQYTGEREGANDAQYAMLAYMTRFLGRITLLLLQESKEG